MNGLLLLILLLIVIPSDDAALQLDRIVLPTSRRKFLTATVTATATAATSRVQPVDAVAPITLQETDTGLARALRLVRPAPPKILRQRLNLDFAVLLMRSSYAATDAINIIAMNQFQRDFFLIRSAEYEPYTKQLGPGFVQQGDLTDPAYFDFISFAQYATINRALSDPATIFEEQQPIPVVDTESSSSNNNTSSITQRFETVVVRRTLPDNQLVPEHEKLVGRAILKYIDDTYGDTYSRLPQFGGNGRPTPAQMEASLTQLVKLFVINGFAWNGSVALVQPTQSWSSSTSSSTLQLATTFCLTLESPATLWSAQSLVVQMSSVGEQLPWRTTPRLRNDFLLKTAQQLALRQGYRVTQTSVQVQGNQEISYLTIS